MELPEPARAKSHSLEESYPYPTSSQSPSALMFLLQGDQLPLPDPWHFFLGVSSCPSVATEIHNPGSNSLSHSWEPPAQPSHALQHPGNGLLGEKLPLAARAPAVRSPRPVPAGVTELGHPSRPHQTASSTGCSAGSRAVTTPLPPPSPLTARPRTALPGSVSS